MGTSPQSPMMGDDGRAVGNVGDTGVAAGGAARGAAGGTATPISTLANDRGPPAEAGCAAACWAAGRGGGAACCVAGRVDANAGPYSRRPPLKT